MVDDCIVLLEWASKNGDRYVSLSLIEKETGIPDDTVRRILLDAQQFKSNSLLFGVAGCFRFSYYIYPEWNREHRFDRRKRIIDATRCNSGSWATTMYQR